MIKINICLSDSSFVLDEKLTSDVAIRLKLHDCYLAMQQPQQATNVLQAIPAKQRTAKVIK